MAAASNTATLDGADEHGDTSWSRNGHRNGHGNGLIGGSNSVVESRPSKPLVAGSNPVSRSLK